jgi:hypothetical protein
MSLEPGTKLGSYEILARLGAGLLKGWWFDSTPHSHFPGSPEPLRADGLVSFGSRMTWRLLGCARVWCHACHTPCHTGQPSPPFRPGVGSPG